MTVECEESRARFQQWYNQRRAVLAHPFGEWATLDQVKNLIDSAEVLRDPSIRNQLISSAVYLLHGAFSNAFRTLELDQDPVDQILACRGRLHAANWEFYRRIGRAIAKIGDLHTRLKFPVVFERRIGFLPLLIEEYHHHRSQRVCHVISHVLPGLDEFDPRLRPGCRVLGYNGTSIEKTISTWAKRSRLNASAFRARALEHLTYRPLGDLTLPSDEFDNGGSDVHAMLSCRWKKENFDVCVPWRFVRVKGADTLKPAEHLGENQKAPDEPPEPRPSRDGELEMFEADVSERDTHRGRAGLFANAAESSRGRKRKLLRRELQPEPGGNSESVGALGDAMKMQFLEYKERGQLHGFAYLRVWHFEAPASESDGAKGQAFALAAAAGLKAMSNREEWPEVSGIVVDLRGNTGGSIPSAECLLNYLHPDGGQISPVLAQFRSTNLTRKYCANRAKAAARRNDLAFEQENFEAWCRSMGTRLEEGLVYSVGRPLTSPDQLKYFEGLDDQRYADRPRLPLVTLVDGRTFSAAEVFAACAIQEELGEVIGHAPATAGGGANQMFIGRISSVVDATALAAGTPGALGVSVRRLVHRPGNETFERVGVRPQFVKPPSRYDLLYDNYDLLLFAARRLVVQKERR